MNNISIITPLFNDWGCLDFLIKDIKESILNSDISEVNIIVVNDSSTIPQPSNFHVEDGISLKIIDLVTNVGHQRAIAIGLCYCLETKIKNSHIIVLDSDGEDSPTYIPNLINTCCEDGNKSIVFAKRTKRSESFNFKVAYFIYKLIFRLFTGQTIAFGNFSCIPRSLLPSICNNPNFWNHYSSSVIKSNINYISIPTKRSKRYLGISKMNVNNLILHGLSSLAVYIEEIIIRLLKLNAILFAVLTFSLSVVVYIKYFTTHAIPGWATVIFGLIFNILVTNIFFNLLIILLHLSNRTRPINLPYDFYSRFIKK